MIDRNVSRVELFGWEPEGNTRSQGSPRGLRFLRDRRTPVAMGDEQDVAESVDEEMRGADALTSDEVGAFDDAPDRPVGLPFADADVTDESLAERAAREIPDLIDDPDEPVRLRWSGNLSAGTDMGAYGPYRAQRCNSRKSAERPIAGVSRFVRGSELAH